MVTHHLHRVRSKRENKKLRCRDADIFESGLAVRPENPYFVWRSNYPRRRDLYLPKKVIDYYHLKIPNSLSLVDKRGNEWEVKIIKWGDGSLVCSSKGWSRLCEANLIDIGDICICEFMQGPRGLSLFVRVIRARTLTRKKGVEEEEVEQVDEKSTYENDNDGDESGMQRNIFKEKRKFKSVSSFAPARRGGGKKGFEEENNKECDENDGDESGMEMNISKAKHKLKSSSSSCAPVRRSARKDNTLGERKGIEEDKIEQIDEVTFFSDLPEETRWNAEDAHRRTIENRDAYIKKLKGIILTLISKDVNQKRVKLSCCRNENNSSDSDIKLIGRSNSLQGTPTMMTICLPEKLELLQSYFQLVHEKTSLSISLYDDVFGKNYKVYIFLEDINKFCLLEPITDCCIIAYMCYLHRKMKKENLLDRFRFVNPNFISFMSTTEQRACALYDRLIDASTNQLVLAPCNVGFHWILTVIDPCNTTVFLLDPLSHRIRDEIWQDIVNKALMMFSASKGEDEKKSPIWVVVKACLQPDSKQCGYYIMRYMREIIETSRDRGLISLESMFTKDSYSESQIDEVRREWAECILDFMG